MRRISRALLLTHLWSAACQPTDAPTGAVTTAGESEASTAPPTTSTPTTDDPTTTTTTSDVLTTTTGPSETTGDPTTTGDPDTDAPPVCGDGAVDPANGEACDLGYALNDDDFGPCTMDCQWAVCGDGLVRTDTESCDQGADNNDTLYQGCTTQCELGPRCGDDTVQGPEECDYGEDNGTSDSPPPLAPRTLGCRFAGKIAFVTSELYTGDLGGEPGAHLKCQARAAQAGLDNSNKFRAWISVGASSPASTFEYGTPEEDVAYIRPDGVRLALHFNDLILDGPGEGVVMTETGELLLDRSVWTSTAPDGQPFNPPQDCEGWTSASPALKGRVGRTGVDPAGPEWFDWTLEFQWTSYATRLCDSSFRLYCFEQ